MAGTTPATSRGWPRAGRIGPHFLRFRCNAPGRPARISRAFGVDGSKSEAILLGLWVRQADIQLGERTGAEPALLIQFYGDELRTVSRNMLGPWTHTVGSRWTRVVQRIPVPPGTKDAIMSTGLMGSTGTLDIDGLTVELVPIGGAATTNLVVNGDFELGDPGPSYWGVKDARRVFPGNGSQAALELSHAGSFARAGVALPVDQFDALEVTIAARCAGLRGASGAKATIYFLNHFGREVRAARARISATLFWNGRGPPAGRTRATRCPCRRARFGPSSRSRSSTGSARSGWTTSGSRPVPTPRPAPGRRSTSKMTRRDWLPVAASPAIAAGGGLDVSFLLPKPAGRDGLVTVKNGRLAFSRGGRRGSWASA